MPSVSRFVPFRTLCPEEKMKQRCRRHFRGQRSKVKVRPQVERDQLSAALVIDNSLVVGGARFDFDSTAVRPLITRDIVNSVSDYVQMDVFTSAKSAQYVEIVGQERKQTSRIAGVTSFNSSVGRNA